MKILYISTDYTDLSVFKSQVHTLCNAHTEKNQVHLVALCNKKELLTEILPDTKYTLTRLSRLPKLFIPELLKWTARRHTETLKPLFLEADLIWCRGHVGTAFALDVQKRIGSHKKILADIRGVIVDELAESDSKFALFYGWCARRLEKVVFSSADYFFFVTEAMKVHFKALYSNLTETKCLGVFPTVVRDDLFYPPSTEDRLAQREKLGIQNEYTYIYVGGTDYWQNLGNMIEQFSLNCANSPDFHFVILTKDVDWVHQTIANLTQPFKNYTVRSVSYEQVGGIMAACDCGLLIRSNSIVNLVASPTKKNEYLAAGLSLCENLEDIGHPISQSIRPIYKPLKQILSEQDSLMREVVSQL